MRFSIRNDLMKNEYQNLGANRRERSKIQINLLLISICLTFIYILLWTMDHKFDSITISFKKNQPLVHSVSNKFLSFGLDSSLLRKMKNLPINDPKFINLARHLCPAYIRIGGTSADCLYFKQTKTEVKIAAIEDLNINPVDSSDVSNFTITGSDFLSLYKFTNSAGIRMIFDLNTLLRNADGTWNSDNAKEIILFAKGHGMELDWQMGNEPNSFFHVFNISVSAEQLAKDYCKLRAILNELGYERSILVGPETNHIGDKIPTGAIYAEKFLENIENCIDYITWHQYYLNGHTAQVQDFLNATIFNQLSNEINTMSEVIKSNRYNISMWISETSSAYGGGAPKLSDRFIAGFLWLDKLGYSAKAGVQVVIRQTLFGGYYAMVDQDLNPNPDWWVAVIYKQFVSENVLNLSISSNFGNVRMYAHCTSMQALINGVPAITVYGININIIQTKLYFQGLQSGSKIFSYILTSDDLQSRNIFMNGEILELQDDGSLPPFKPKILEINQIIILPPYSMVFLLIHGIEIPACLKYKNL